MAVPDQLPVKSMSPMYAELHCLSNFTFLCGASHPEELGARADELGYAALALTDECSLAGVVRAHQAPQNAGLKLIVGAEFHLVEGTHLVLLAPTTRLTALARLYPSQLLAETVRIAQRCHFSLDELRYEYPDELVPAGETPTSHLARLTQEGLGRRWPGGVPPGSPRASRRSWR